MPYMDLEVRRAKAREYTRSYRKRHPAKARESTRRSAAQWRHAHNELATNAPSRRFRRVLQWMKYWDGCERCGVRTRVLSSHHPRGVVKTISPGNPGTPTHEKWLELLQCKTLCNRCHVVGEHGLGKGGASR